MFSKKIVAKRRSFQIVIGLEEGYGTNKRHSALEVQNLIGLWMRLRMEAGSPVLTGGLLLPGTMIYAWKSPATGVKVNLEGTLLFVGEVNPLYNADLSNNEVVDLLTDLAGMLGTELNQTRMYVTYMDDIIVLQNEKSVHPTEKKTEV